MTLDAEKDGTRLQPAGITPALGQVAFGGAVWTFVQTFGSKLAGVGSQLVLAAIIRNEDFGLILQASFITSIAAVGSQLGLAEILIRRHRRLDRWAEIAFWIALTGGLIGGLFVVAIAPFAHYLYKDTSGIEKLLWVAAIGLPFDAILLVPQAKLRADLRFRATALIGAFNTVGLAFLSVCFALSVKIWPNSPIAGAMALILPKPIISFATFLISWRLSGLKLQFRPMFRRWGFILRDSRYIFITMMANTFIGQGDNLVAGMVFNKAQLGAYYFAFNLSTQTSQLVGVNIASILLPSFAKLDREPERQRQAYFRVCALVAFIGTIICAGQWVLGGAILHLAYGHKWDDAIPLFRWLTLGMAFVLPSTAGISLVQAKGKFRWYMIWSITVAISFVLAVSIGASTRSIINIAIADAIFYFIFGPLGVLMPFEFSARNSLRPLLDVYLFPIVTAILGIVVGLSAAYLLAIPYELLRDAIAALIALLVYICAAWKWKQNEIRETRMRLQPLLLRFSLRREAVS